MNDAIKMQISAFVDGELPHNEAELLLRRLCQDRELRQQAAEYLSMGRVMRGERSVAGIKKLRERISAALDDTAIQEEFDEAKSERPRYLRPMAGVAIAATVALAALFGLQRINTVDIGTAPGAEAVADAAGVTLPPVPEPSDEFADELRQYRAIHISGYDDIESRLDSLQRRGDAIVDTEADDAEAEADTNAAADQQTP